MSVWVKGTESPDLVCLLGVIYKGSVVYGVFLQNGRARFDLRDANGKLLRCETHASLVDQTWHHIKWVVDSASEGRCHIYLDSQEVKHFITTAENPDSFAPMKQTDMKSFFPSDSLIGALPSPESEAKVAHCFKGWIKDLRLSNNNTPTYRWPMDSGVRSTVTEVVTLSPLCTGSTWRCTWDPTEEPPTSLCFSGAESMTAVGPYGLSAKPWRLTLWVKTTATEPMTVIEMEGEDGTLGEVRLNDPTPSACSFSIQKGDVAEVATATSALCDGDWHEISCGVGGESHIEIDVAIDATRVTQRVNGVACDNDNDNGNANQWDAEEGSDGEDDCDDMARSPTEVFHMLSQNNTSFFEFGLVVTVPKSYIGFLRHLSITAHGDVLSELLLDEACGERCANSIHDQQFEYDADADRKANDGFLSSSDVWRPTFPPPFVLYLNTEAMIWTECLLDSLEDFTVELFIKTKRPANRCRLVSGALQNPKEFYLIELDAARDKAFLTLCVPQDDEVEVICCAGDVTICDDSWHKLSWSFSRKCKERRRLLADNVPVGVSAAEPCLSTLHTHYTKAGFDVTRYRIKESPLESAKNDAETLCNADDIDMTLADTKITLPACEANTLIIGGSSLSCYVMSVCISSGEKQISASLPLSEGFGSSLTVHPSGKRAQCSGVQWKATGRAKCALYLDGSCSYIDIGSTAPHFVPEHFRSFSLELWLKCGNILTPQTLWAISDTHNPELEASASLVLNKVRPGSISMQVTDSFGRTLQAHVDLNIFDVVWHNLRWVVSSSEDGAMELFVNSKAVALEIESEAPRSFHQGASPCMRIGATPLAIPVHMFDGALRYVTICQPHDGPPVATWPLEEGKGCTAGDISGNSLIGDIYSPLWMYTATPSLTLKLCGAGATFTATVENEVISKCAFWVHYTKSEPAVLFSVKCGELLRFKVSVNQEPPGCNIEQFQKKGLLTISSGGDSCVAAADCGDALSCGEWRHLAFEMIESEDQVSFKIHVNHVPLPVTYFKKERPPGIESPDLLHSSTLCIGDLTTPLEACIRCVTAYDSTGRVLLNFPLSHSLAGTAEKCVVICSVSHYEWVLSPLPPSIPYFNGHSTYANVGTVTEFGEEMAYPWSASLRLQCVNREAVKTQTLLSLIDGKKRLLLELHPEGGGGGVHAWHIRLVVSDADGAAFEVIYTASVLSDGLWHALRLEVVPFPEIKATLSIDGTPTPLWYGVCGTPTKFTSWDAPLYVGAHRRHSGITQHFFGCLTDVTLAYVKPAKSHEVIDSEGNPNPSFATNESIVAKWNLRTGYGNEAPDSNTSTEEAYHGSIVSCVWQFDETSPEIPRQRDDILRDASREAKITVSNWSGDTRDESSARNGGVTLTEFPIGEGWSSGEPAPQWIQFDLQRNIPLHGLDLLSRLDSPVEINFQKQEPPHIGVHSIMVGGLNTPLVKIGEIRCMDIDYTCTKWRMAKAAPVVRTIRIVSEKSDYRVGWRAIKVLIPHDFKHSLRMCQDSERSQLSVEKPLRVHDPETIAVLFKRYDILRRGKIPRTVLMRFFKEFSVGLDLTDRQLDRHLSHHIKSNDATKEVNLHEFSELVLRMSQW